MELDLLLTDHEIAVVHFFWNGVEAGIEVEVDERPLFVLQLVYDGRLFKLPLDVGELPVIPDLLDAKRSCFALVPAIVKVQIARIRACIFFLSVLSCLPIRG